MKRGPLSKNQKNRLDLVNIKTKRQLPAKSPPYPRPGWTTRPTSNNIRAHPEWARPRMKPRGLGRGTGFLTCPRPHATRPRMRCRFSDSPEASCCKASDKVPILRLARGRLGNDPVTAASTDFSDRTSRPTNTFNHSRNVSRTSAQYSGVADGTGVTSTPCG